MGEKIFDKLVNSFGSITSGTTSITTTTTTGWGPSSTVEDMVSGIGGDVYPTIHTEKSALPVRVKRIVDRMKKEETFGDLEFYIEFRRDYINPGIMLVLVTNEDDHILFHTSVGAGEDSTDEMWRNMEDLVLENGLVNPIRMVTGIEAAGL